ncbi:universal stress protein [Anaerophaga thermohalophila]|jgi:nucleotide-binding universal stress UspA family protein|uniref:universal stress protein n=1 Tax=Anaerophaga thermohalophila TaxID=177400 RepID=UPI0002DAC9BF|nr:universal stress protein [Anaerophaga thermohalophila]
MKRILVPIDFSENSVFALQVAVELSNQLHSALRIIHVQTGQKYAPEFLGDNPESRLMGQAGQWLEHLIERFSGDYRVYNGEFDYKIREGNVVREINNQARYDDASLIVVGTHGVSGVEDKWLGSNAYRLVSHAPCPVLTIRKEMKWESPHKILLPLDDNKLTRKIVPIVTGFAKLLKAGIEIIALQKKSKWLIPGRSDIYAKQAERYIKSNTDLDVNIVPFRWGGQAKNILELAHNKSATVIAIHLNKSIHPFESFFRPFANELLNISDIPVLVVPVKE